MNDVTWGMHRIFFSISSLIKLTYGSNWMRFVSTRSSTIFCSPEVCFEVDSPFSFMLESDLCDPEEEEGRSSSSGLGCINVKGNSATRSLKRIAMQFLLWVVRQWGSFFLCRTIDALVAEPKIRLCFPRFVLIRSDQRVTLKIILIPSVYKLARQQKKIGQKR